MSLRPIALVALLVAGCGAQPSASSEPAQSWCSSAYPNGILTGQSPRLSIFYTLSAASGMEVTEFGHANLPEHFTGIMNETVATTGTTFFVADGSAGNIGLDLTLTADATHDHYGLTAVVDGPESLHMGAGGSTTSVKLFTLRKDDVYAKVDTLLAEAAAEIGKVITNGWTCNQFGNMVPRP
ncbi:MAG TPA: hypothetical protein VMZ28_03810 [Kofleriaceae bacterium]|nr:hypothetical protein [Kofleriaceae bacterium]